MSTSTPADGPASALPRDARASAAAGRDPLVRSRDQRLVAGVCAGLAAHLRWPVGLVRAAMLVLGFLGGAGVLLYAWFWVTVPWGSDDVVEPMRRALTRPASTGPAGLAAGAAAAVMSPVAAPTGAAPRSATQTSSGTAGADPSDTSQAGAALAGAALAGEPQISAIPGASADRTTPGSRNRPHLPIAELLLGGALLAVGVVLILVQVGVEIDLTILLPTLAVLVGVGLAWWQIADRDRPERSQVPRVLGALGLVAFGVLTFFITADQPSILTVIAAALAVLAGVALALAPWVLRINRDLIAERAGRAREAERAEIAAHLHDSVLQTLAAIQQRSEPGSDVARLARGQERELREWLFRAADGADAPPRESLDVELRAHAAALEEVHPVRFEVVGVGTLSAPDVEGVAPEPIVAAAREAMLNAAQHAGGEVSVYAELTPTQVSIDVTDRGPGLDTEALPAGRMGVRESIIGRMERAGGTARLVPGPGGTGTSVRLNMTMPTQEDADA